MFVQDFVTIDGAYLDVAIHLVADPVTLLHSAVGPTRREGEQFKARVAPASWPAVLAKTVNVHVEAVRQFEDSVIVGFAWEAAGGASLFPRLDGDLEVAPFGSERTNVTIRGTYRPPAGLIGRQLDELVLHRLAEATVRAFLSNVCACLCRSIQAGTRGVQGAAGQDRQTATTAGRLAP
jgi:hypothetical protein